MYVNGMGIRGIARVKGITPPIVSDRSLKIIAIALLTMRYI